MNPIPRKALDRLNAKTIKYFQSELDKAKSRGDNEADTVKIVIEMLSEIFGYDKLNEIKSEHAIKGTYCDLAIKLNDLDKPCFLVETKAINIELKDSHINQAVAYGAREGVKWVILTNGIHWNLYKVIVNEFVDQELIIDFDFSLLNSRDADHLEKLFHLTKEAVMRRCLEDYDAHQQAMSRFSLAATIISKPVLEVIRRELRRVSPNAKITTEEIESALRSYVLKGEVFEGAKAVEAQKKITKAQKKAAKASDSLAPILASCSPFVKDSTTPSASEQPPAT
jgi:predicted type IV restriction endonuclease